MFINMSGIVTHHNLNKIKIPNTERKRLNKMTNDRPGVTLIYINQKNIKKLC
jgi:hypothetical protein